MRLWNFSLSLLVFSVAALASQDPFFELQWGLRNTGQTIPHSIDDLHTEMMRGQPGADVNIQGLQELLKGRLKKVPIVAVLDTGVDLKHPDLSPSLLSNGRDFTTDNPKLRNIPQDNDGHGTHVSGVIAAIADNRIGVSGVASLIRILPIKVYTQQGTTNNTPYGTRLALGIRHAISQSADVINMSLGAPLFDVNEDLREAFREAKRKGIAIVAASGNLGHGITPFPCSLTEVICVGAVTITGQIASFSNQSGHVDLLGPGDAILSTYPQKLGPKNFAEHGYSYLSGTSQAAPFVSAAAAILKGVYPDISLDELRGRLYESALRRPNRIDSISGLVQVIAAINISPTSSIRPVFKELRDVEIDDAGNFSLALPIKNYWLKGQNVQIEIQPEKAGIFLQTTQFIIDEFAPSEVKILPLEGKLPNLDAEARQNLVIKITIDNQTQQYSHLFNFFRKVNATLEGFKHYSVLTNASSRAFRRLSNGNLALSLKPILSSTGRLNTAEFYMTAPSDRGIELTAYLHQDGKYIEKTITLSDRKIVYSVRRLGRGYLVRSLGNEAKPAGKIEHYLYLDSQFKPLYGEKSDYSFSTYESFSVNERELQFIPLRVGSSPILVPVFLQNGYMPEGDYNPNPYEADPLSLNTPLHEIGRHLYYFKPDPAQQNFEIRAVDNMNFFYKTYKDLHLSWNDSFQIVRTLEHRSEAGASFLANVVQDSITRSFILTVSENMSTSLQEISVPVELEQARFAPVTSLTGHTIQYSSDSLFGWFQSPYQVYFGGIAKVSGLSGGFAELERNGDPAGFLLNGFLDDSSSYYFLQTGKDLVAIQKKLGSLSTKRYSLFRAQYIPHSVYANMYSPVVVSTDGILQPGFFVDASLLDINTAYVVTLKADTLSAPVRYNFLPRNNCVFNEPSTMSGRDQISMICQGEGEISFDFILL